MILSGCVAHSAGVVEKPEVTLRRVLPNLQFESIGPTEITGLYEVISGQNVFYYYPEKEYLIFGDIFTVSGQNITAEKKSEIASNMAKSLPLEKAVRIGNGRTTVIEFTDPDCPYCKKAYDFFKARNDVTIYSFFSPLVHPAAISKIYYILNAVDKAKAYHEVFEGKSLSPPPEGYSDAVKKLAAEHMALAKSVGVTGTPTFFINGKQVVGADFQQIEKLLGDASKNDGKKTEKSNQDQQR